MRLQASAASLGVIVETIRCAVDFEIAKIAPSSRTVRLARSAAQAMSTRWWIEYDHGRPRLGSAGSRAATWAIWRSDIAVIATMFDVSAVTATMFDVMTTV